MAERGRLTSCADLPALYGEEIGQRRAETNRAGIGVLRPDNLGGGVGEVKPALGRISILILAMGNEAH